MWSNIFVYGSRGPHLLGAIDVAGALAEGVFLELVAFPCWDKRYSMPLGVIQFGGQAYFRIYTGTGLGQALREGCDCILLLAPLGAEAFVKSVLHSLELSLEWQGTPMPDNSLGYWYRCGPIIRGPAIGEEEWFSCPLKELGGRLPGAYTRLYGCVVELLVHITKARAGAVPLDWELVRRMLWCIRRSARGDRRLADRLTESLLGLLGGMQ